MQRKLNKASNFNRRKNSILSRWYNVTWQIDGSGRAYNTPTLGSELLTNVEFTSDTTGWLSANGAVLTRRDFASSPNISPTGGTDDWGLEVAYGGISSPGGRQQQTLIVGNWYRVLTRAYAPSTNVATFASALHMVQPSGLILQVSAEDAWQLLAQTGRAAATSGDIRLRYVGSTLTDTAYFDAPSAKAITLSTAFTTVTGTVSNQTVAAKINTITVGTQVGVASLLDSSSNPQNFIIAYHDGTNVKLEKCVAGVYTQLISTAVTFVSNAQIEIRRPSGNTFQLWYNGTQRGTDQTISDSGIINNTLYGMFSTYSGNLISEFSLGGVVIPFTF